MTALRFVLPALAALCLAAPAAAGPTLIPDPTGDVAAGTSPDIVSFYGSWEGLSHYAFGATFAGPIAAPSAFAANSVYGYIDLDTDANPATGGTAPWGGPSPGGNSWVNQAVLYGFVAGPPMALGSEYFLDIGYEGLPGKAGLVGLFSTATNALVAEIPVVFTANGFSLIFPQGLVGSPGIFNYGLLLGDVNFPFSADRAPNGAAPARITPEPASLALLALGLAGAGLACRRRARRAA